MRKTRKIPLHASVDSDLVEYVEAIWEKRPQGTSKSSVVNEILRIGIEEHKKQQK